MTEHLNSAYRERTPSRRGERNGHYTRSLITPVGKIEQLRVPRDREGTFVTKVSDRYKRMTGEVEEAVLEMFIQGGLTRKEAWNFLDMSPLWAMEYKSTKFAASPAQKLKGWM